MKQEIFKVLLETSINDTIEDVQFEYVAKKISELPEFKKVNFDDVIDLSVTIVNKLVELGLVKDCTDTDDETEFIFQDIIREQLSLRLNKLGVYEHLHSDGEKVHD